MYFGIFFILEVDFFVRVFEYDYGYEKFIERGGKSVNLILKVLVVFFFLFYN